MSNNVNANANDAEVENPQAHQGGGGGVNHFAQSLLRGFLIYMCMSFLRDHSGLFPKMQNPADTMATATTGGEEGSNDAPMKPVGADPDSQQPRQQQRKRVLPPKAPSCLWEAGTLFDVHVYFNDEAEFDKMKNCPNHGKNGNHRNHKRDSPSLTEWHLSDMVLGSVNDLVRKDLTSNVTLPLPRSTQFNESHIYAHVCMVRQTNNNVNDNTNNEKEMYQEEDVLLQSVPMTKHRLRKRTRDEKSLLASEGDAIATNPHHDAVLSLTKAEQAKLSPLTLSSVNTTMDARLLYIKPSLNLDIVQGIPTFTTRSHLPVQISKHMQFAHENSSEYYPLLYSSEFWITKASHIEVNDTLAETTIEITIRDVSMWKWQTTSQMEAQWEMQEKMDGGEEGDSDMLRNLLMDTNPILLAVTGIVSVLHTVFDILAFKNDISFFKGKKSMEGISLLSMVINTVFQVIILLYLIDNETSFMILCSNGIGVVIECWKISKAVQISFFDTATGSLKIQWKESDTYSSSKTKEYDEIATNHLMFVTMPLVTGYGLYSLLFQKHKGWYSWILNTLVGFIYMFGFVMMTPQLFINYKLQSVAHLNWRTMTYKSINTFIDDLFAFVIKMPIMHRLACLRDDVIFIIFCYQRYKYRTDYTRVNEFGQCLQPTEKMMEEIAASRDEKSLAGGAESGVRNTEEEPNVTRRGRRGAKDKRE